MCFSESSVLALFSGKIPTFRLQSDFPAKGASDFSVNYRKFGFWCRLCSLPENRKYNRKIGLDPRTRQFTGKSDCNRTVGILPEKQMNSPNIPNSNFSHKKVTFAEKYENTYVDIFDVGSVTRQPVFQWLKRQRVKVS